MEGHFWASRTDKNVNQCYFFENFQKIEAKVYQCVGIHIWIKKSMTVFFSTVQFLTYDLLKLSN